MVNKSLEIATRGLYLEGAKLLIHFGARDEENNALLCAIDYGYFDMFQYLIDFGGSDLNSKKLTKSILAPLQHENKKMYEFLKEKGLIVDLKSRSSEEEENKSNSNSSKRWSWSKGSEGNSTNQEKEGEYSEEGGWSWDENSEKEENE